MEELKEFTNEVIYESYRTQKLSSGEVVEKSSSEKYALNYV
jgi:septin family protein